MVVVLPHIIHSCDTPTRGRNGLLDSSREGLQLPEDDRISYGDEPMDELLGVFGMAIHLLEMFHSPNVCRMG